MIYSGWLRWSLTVVIPVAFAVTVPAEVVSGRLDPPTLALSVVVAFASLVPSRAPCLQRRVSLRTLLGGWPRPGYDAGNA